MKGVASTAGLLVLHAAAPATAQTPAAVFTGPSAGSKQAIWSIVGGGVEYRARPRVGARLQLVHVDNQTWSVFAGVPIRF